MQPIQYMMAQVDTDFQQQVQGWAAGTRLYICKVVLLLAKAVAFGRAAAIVV